VHFRPGFANAQTVPDEKSAIFKAPGGEPLGVGSAPWRRPRRPSLGRRRGKGSTAAATRSYLLGPAKLTLTSKRWSKGISTRYTEAAFGTTPLSAGGS
jgi:hypothetical protein